MNRKPSVSEMRRIESKELKDIEEEKEAKRIVSELPSVLQLGSFCFKDSQTREVKPFMRCVHNVRIDDCLYQVFHKHWKIKRPTIVVLIITNVAPLHEWTNTRQIKQFQRGIIKAAENTNMWLVCNAIHMGSTALIGEAVRQEITESKYKKAKKEKTISKLNVIGIADEDMLRYGASLASSSNYKIEVPNDGCSGDAKYELNSELTRYIVIKDQTFNKSGVNTFLTNFVSFLIANQKFSDNCDKKPCDLCSLTDTEVPVVSIIINGGLDTSRLVLQQIKNRIPIVVLRGSGGLADLLAFVEYEIRERCLDVWDPELIETYLKPELTMRISQHFPKLRKNVPLCNTFRNRILDCVRESRKDGQIYLTVINMFNSYSCNLENLTEYLLLALFKTQRSSLSQMVGNELKIEEIKPSTELIRKNLYLCVDWNCPDVAKKEVFNKDPSFVLNLEKKLFEESLTRRNRREFIDLFLSQKFKLRSFVSEKRLRRMFRKIHLHEFFRMVCWEGILGRTPDMKQSNEFIIRELNWLIEACTGLTGFVDEEELNYFALGQFPASEREAERKSLAILVMWGLLDNRRRLVRLLWKHSDQPIHLAIIIGMFYDRLSWYVSEQELNAELKQESQLFVNYAYNALDSVYKDSADLAEQVLNESSKDWNYKTPVDLAAFAKFRSFFAHPSCQKWLTNTFNGGISLRDLRFGFMRLPAFAKILMSAFILFPMYFWIRFNYDPNAGIQEEEFIEDEDDSVSVNTEINNIENKVEKSQSNKESEKKLSDKMSTIVMADKEILIPNQPMPWIMAYKLWNAPITKFWNFQLFYILYLSLFSVAVLFPRCGNIYLDSLVCFWTVLIVADLIRQTYLYHIKYPNQSISLKIIEILFQTIILVVYVSGRLLSNQRFASMTTYNEKVILSIALLYAYYVLIAVFLPISATLGPLLFRLKIMILVDFINFIRLSIVVIVAFGIVIQAVTYPDKPINKDMFFETFHRALISLFLTPTADLTSDAQCNEKYLRTVNTTDEEKLVCYASKYTRSHCRNFGFWPYFLTIVYFVLLKLILTTLLYAIFASSASSLTADTDTIWKYQRYTIVMNFVRRLPLPPPLNIFYYIFCAIRWLYQLICCNKDRKKDLFKLGLFSSTEQENQTKLLAEEDYNYLKTIAFECYDQQENKTTEDSISRLQWERIQANSEEMEYEKKILRRLKGKMSEMERSVRESLVYLESIKHLTSKKHGIESGLKKTKMHVISRHSPYPLTNVERYPVPDKYVSWDVMWIDYDPIAYTKPKQEFHTSQQQFADEDLLLLQELQIEQLTKNLPVFEWNRSSTNAAGITIDRESWESGDNETKTIYKLDNGIPINPFGRTGLRGRGGLLRWGPNHYLMVIITNYSSSNVLQVIVEKNDAKNDTLSLLKRFLPGECTYTQIESLFKTNDQQKNWTTSEKMIDYFKSYDTNNEILTEAATDKKDLHSIMKFEKIMRGYFDDPLNTDQAWKEVELWHFHYFQNEKLKDNMMNTIEWHSVSEDLFAKFNLSQSTVMQEVVAKLKVDIHS